MKKRETICVTINRNLLNKLDSAKGIAPRSRFLERIISEYFGMIKK